MSHQKMKPVTVRDVVKAITAVAIAVIPGIAGTVVTGVPAVASVWFLGALIGIVSSMESSWRLSLRTAPTAAFFAALAVWVHPSALASAVLVGAAVVAAAALTRSGIHIAYAQVPFAAAFMVIHPAAVMDPTHPTIWYSLAIAALMLGGAAWSTWTGNLKWLYPRDAALPPRPPLIATVTYAAIVAPIVGICTFILLAFFPDMMGGWLLISILALVQPEVMDTPGHALERVIGTLAGAMLAGGIVAVLNPSFLLSQVFVVICISLALVVIAANGPYWLFMLLFTPAVVIVAASLSNDPVSVVGQRPLLTLIGALIAVGAAQVLGYFAKYHDHPISED